MTMSEASLFVKVVPFVVAAAVVEAKVQGPKTLIGGVLNSVGVVFATELGDKTFFVAAILATKYDLVTVYLGCWGALAVMTLISAIMGALIPSLIGAVLPSSMQRLIRIPPILLLLYFGGNMLYDALNDLSEGKLDNEGMLEELEDAEKEVKQRLAAAGFNDQEREQSQTQASSEDENQILSGFFVHDTETESIGGDNQNQPLENRSKSKRTFSDMFSERNLNLLQEFFIMTFLAEWGDKSQIATVAMSSAANPIGIAIGGIMGHAACTGIAIATGHLISEQKFVSEAHISFIGGLIFVIFSLHSLVNL